MSAARLLQRRPDEEAGVADAAVVPRTTRHKCCPFSRRWGLNRPGMILFLSDVANLSVASVLTLNVYAATFFWVWGKAGSTCIVGKAVNEEKEGFSDDVKSIIQNVIVFLPFVLFPITAYVSGLAKALERDSRLLGFVAGMYLAEVAYMFSLGGLMVVCTSGANWKIVLAGTSTIIILIFVGWSCFCYHPKCLRFTFCMCCCDRDDHEDGIEELGAG